MFKKRGDIVSTWQSKLYRSQLLHTLDRLNRHLDILYVYIHLFSGNIHKYNVSATMYKNRDESLRLTEATCLVFNMVFTKVRYDTYMKN